MLGPPKQGKISSAGDQEMSLYSTVGQENIDVLKFVILAVIIFCHHFVAFLVTTFIICIQSFLGCIIFVIFYVLFCVTIPFPPFKFLLKT